MTVRSCLTMGTFRRPLGKAMSAWNAILHELGKLEGLVHTWKFYGASVVAGIRWTTLIVAMRMFQPES